MSSFPIISPSNLQGRGGAQDLGQQRRDAAQHDLHLLARVHHVVGQDAQPLASTTKAVGRWDGGIDVGECRFTIKSALMLMNMLVNVGETILQVNFMIF